MQYDEFVKHVRERAGLGREDAERMLRAVLTTLAERLVEGEALDLAAQLPRDLQPATRAADEHGEQFSADEFVERVAERTGVPHGLADDASRAVLATLREAVSPGEMDDVLAGLTEDYHELFEAPPGP